jgi:hypothetical protein
LEAPPGFEPGMEVLQTSALPLGDGAVRTTIGLEFQGYLKVSIIACPSGTDSTPARLR